MLFLTTPLNSVSFRMNGGISVPRFTVVSLVIATILMAMAGCGARRIGHISIDDASANESNDGEAANLVFTVTLTKQLIAGSNVTVDWATADGIATITDNDYVLANGTAAPSETCWKRS